MKRRDVKVNDIELTCELSDLLDHQKMKSE
jgi:hypothetical protein